MGIILAGPKNRGRVRIKKQRILYRLLDETLHILLTFLIGVAIAVAYHELITAKSIHSIAERVCEIYGKDEQECKNGIEGILSESENVVDNNLTIKVK